MRKTALLALLPLSTLLSVQAMAQSTSSTLDARVGKLEKEVKAVQRVVFPNGAGLQPELTAQPTTPGTIGTPASSPVADLTARVDALEAQLTSLTGQSEQNMFKLRQMEDAFAKYKAETDARLKALEPSAEPPAVTPTTTPAPAAGTGTRPAATTPAKPAATAPATTAAPVSAERKAAVAAIERPSTGDAAGDAYTYGYRLWAAKFYPEAQAQLKATVDKYGTTSVASRSQNLLGRAYLDDGKPNLAALAFRDSYEKWPQGDRAPDSLTYLGEALIKLKKPADACKVYSVLEDSYGSSLSASLRAMMVKGRATAKCAS